MIKSILKHLVLLIEQEHAALKSKWTREDTFYKIKELSIDQRGRIGEHFFRDIFKELNMTVTYVNNYCGDWDLEVNGLKVEVKTATLDVNGKFQHEGVKSSKKWDLVAFLDISPNKIHTTFVHKDSFTFGIPSPTTKDPQRQVGTISFNRVNSNIHHRGKDGSSESATGVGYKIDFKEKDLVEVKTIKDFENTWNTLVSSIGDPNAN